MLILFEGQVLCNSTKSGIGWYTYNLTKSILEIDSINQYTLTIFDFLNRNHNQLIEIDDFLRFPNLSLKKCSYIPYRFFIKNQGIFKVIPINYFFKKPDLFHFFNFITPPKISGKVITTVYDMVCKVIPESMEKHNLVESSNKSRAFL